MEPNEPQNEQSSSCPAQVLMPDMLTVLSNRIERGHISVSAYLRSRIADLPEIKPASPSCTASELLEALHLNGDEPDGLSLAQRLLGEDPNRDDLETVIILKGAVEYLTFILSERIASPYEEAVGRNLAAVLDRIVEREGNLCSLAMDLARAISIYRPDLLAQGTQEFFMNRQVMVSVLLIPVQRRYGFCAWLRDRCFPN
ncbi:hypothetical protein JW766_02170 [Candidatus Dojkabacteria bacterium]|nr:hypothetical protein [Candidatus Dojkabacteria bacterium]